MSWRVVRLAPVNYSLYSVLFCSALFRGRDELAHTNAENTPRYSMCVWKPSWTSRVCTGSKAFCRDLIYLQSSVRNLKFSWLCCWAGRRNTTGRSSSESTSKQVKGMHIPGEYQNWIKVLSASPDASCISGICWWRNWINWMECYSAEKMLMQSSNVSASNVAQRECCHYTGYAWLTSVCVCVCLLCDPALTEANIKYSKDLKK